MLWLYVENGLLGLHIDILHQSTIPFSEFKSDFPNLLRVSTMEDPDILTVFINY